MLGPCSGALSRTVQGPLTAPLINVRLHEPKLVGMPIFRALGCTCRKRLKESNPQKFVGSTSETKGRAFLIEATRGDRAKSLAANGELAPRFKAWARKEVGLKIDKSQAFFAVPHLRFLSPSRSQVWSPVAIKFKSKWKKHDINWCVMLNGSEHERGHIFRGTLKRRRFHSGRDAALIRRSKKIWPHLGCFVPCPLFVVRFSIYWYVSYWQKWLLKQKLSMTWIFYFQCAELISVKNCAKQAAWYLFHIAPHVKMRTSEGNEIMLSNETLRFFSTTVCAHSQLKICISEQQKFPQAASILCFFHIEWSADTLRVPFKKPTPYLFSLAPRIFL